MADDSTQVLVLQHTEHEHLGLIANALETEDVGYAYIRSDLGQAIPSTLDGYQGLIVMGGPQSVYEEDQFSFLAPEKALVHHAVMAGHPVLGICLGSQILAEVLGARVYSSGTFEIGWKEVHLSNEAEEDFVLGHMPRIFKPLHWHGDVFELPRGAKPIGSSELASVQGFSWNERVYGLLFHLEMTPDQLNAMAVAFPGDLERGGMAPDVLLAETQHCFDSLRELSLETFRRWTTLF